MDLPHSDACFVQAYPAQTAEAFCDGHRSEPARSAARGGRSGVGALRPMGDDAPMGEDARSRHSPIPSRNRRVCLFLASIGSVPPFGTGNRSSLQEPRVTRFRGGREGRLLWPIASHFGPGPIRGSSPVGTQAATASGRLIKRGKSCSTENRMLQLYAKTCITSVRVILQSSMSRTPSTTLLEKWSRQYSPH